MMVTTKSLLIIVLILGGIGLFVFGILRSPTPGEESVENETQEEQELPAGSSDTIGAGGDAPASDNPQAPAVKSDGSSQNTSPLAPQAKTGRLVFAITDDAASLNDIDSIFVSIADISIRNISTGWISVTNDQKTYDLLKLKREGKLELMFDKTIPEGTYTQLHFTVSPVVVVKNGLADTAALPSSAIDIPLSLPMRPGQTAAVTIDFIADKSLHITNAKKYIFAPVIEISVQGEIQAVQKSGTKVEFFGGLPKFSAHFGMDETGAMKQFTFGIDSLSDIEIERGIFVLIPSSVDRSLFNITPATAMDAALGSAYITRVLSVYAGIIDNQPTWLVYGTTRTGNTANVYIDAATGEVLKVQ